MNTYSNELYHYGVLGMRWGVRKAVRNDAAVRKARSAYKSYRGDKRQKQALKGAYRKAQANARYKAFKKRYVNSSDESLKYIANQSTGKALLKSFLLSSYGTLKYDEARSKGSSEIAAGAQAVGFMAGNAFTYGWGSVAEGFYRRGQLPGSRRRNN